MISTCIVGYQRQSLGKIGILLFLSSSVRASSFLLGSRLRTRARAFSVAGRSTTKGDLEVMTVPELKEQLRTLGLQVGGRKSELVDRIMFTGTTSGISNEGSVKDDKFLDRLSQDSSLQESEPVSQRLGDCDLPERIREAFLCGETDGILDLAQSLPIDKFSPEELVSATIQVSQNNKRQAAGSLNSWIGACTILDDASVGARLAWELLAAYDEVSESIGVYPDVVTLSLVYSALIRDPQASAMAKDVLERASRLSKKLGGSKRRKSLATSRRQKSGMTAKEIEEKLQSMYGPDFKVLQETAEFIVISKPSGMVCFHKSKTTAGKISKRKKGQSGSKVTDISLEDALLHQHIMLSTLNHEARGIVHRIDRGTSGCIVLAKTDAMHARLVSEFFLRRVKKSYKALVSANNDLPDEGVVNIAVNNRPAKSSFEVVERYGNLASLLQLSTFTGRKHQVRVHCAKGLGAPILMDSLYAEDSDASLWPKAVAELCSDKQQRFFLHASSLSIQEYGIEAEAPLSTLWEKATAALRDDS